MIDTIKKIDTELFLYLNSRHNAFFDVIMYWASHKWFWMPFYLLLVFFIYRIYNKAYKYVLLAIGVLMVLSDQISSSIIKQLTQRLRPSHEPSLIHLIHLSKAGPGGMYGFVSGHATNAAALAVFLILLFPRRYNRLKIVLVFWTLLVAYSRIYNGVHYPLDVICGMMVGSLTALVVYYVFKQKILKKNNSFNLIK